MTGQTRLGTGSLLERAAEIYDFQAELRRRPQAVAAVPAAPALPLSAEPSPDDTIVAPQPLRARSAAPAPRRQGRIDPDRLRAGGFILPEEAVGALAEEFRIIKRQLLRSLSPRSADPRARTILIASSQPGEGKSFCAVNLALSLAGERDIEVLLVDGDFNKPSLPGLLGLEAGPGLIDAIADRNADPNDFVIGTDIEGLAFLPAGRHVKNVTELVASNRTSEVLRALAEGHPSRVLIFDSPPALVASPASVLASHAGQVMMVVRADRTTDADLREALALLSACDSISLVLNATRLVVSGRRFGSYYGYGE